MSKKLLIVESPAKAKTINKYLGGDFIVKSSYGHIRDLDKGDKGIDKEKNFQPKYVVSPEKRKVVKELKAAAKSVSEVWLATDEDREGEAIAWHLCQVLGLDEDTTKRIVFREITKNAIQNAVSNPRIVDKHLVNAQQARRILDRLVGFELSEILWRKIKGRLSAGRVQSVAVKLIVDREREINDHEAQSFFKVIALFTVKNELGQNVELKAELDRRLSTLEEARALLEDLKGTTYTIESIKVKPGKRRPAPPFITSTLQQEASRKLSFSVNRTMSAAQKLYENGHITYMRTDSTNLSEMAIGTIAKTIREEYGDQYSQVRRYATKGSKAQEAHEAIRPTFADRKSVDANSDQSRLYDLIWKRTIASQMADARLEKTEVKIQCSNNNTFEAFGEVLKFEGFLKVYMEGKDDDGPEEAKDILPPLEVGQVLDNKSVKATERFTRPPARYTEASLVKKLEELGIGRPSTYAPTISKIMEKERGYVTKESRPGVERHYYEVTLENDDLTQQQLTEITGATSNRLYPSDMGMLVSDFLTKHFAEIMNYSFTADIEDKLDEIASGKENWQEMLDDFYGPFHETVEKTIEEAQREKGRRVLGTLEEGGQKFTVLTQMTRFGPVVQIGTKEEVGENGKPRFANLRPGQSLETITREEAMELFKLPLDLGEHEGLPITVNSGRYGPYIKFGDTFVSLPRGEDPLAVSRERAVELIEEKKKADAPIGEYEGNPITKGKGRFGPFVKWNDLYVNIPKRINPDTLTLEECIPLIKAKVEKEAKRYIVQWPDENIAIENGRWGPFIRLKKKAFKLPKKENGDKWEAEELKSTPLETVKKWLKDQGAKGI